MEEDPTSEAPSSPLPVLKALEVLEAFKQASHDLQTHPRPDPTDSSSAAATALLELETVSDHILSRDPNLSTLTHHLSDLKSLIGTLHQTRGYGLRSFLARRAAAHSISRVAAAIQREIQAWIDRESVERLTRALGEPVGDEDELVKQLGQFESRVMEGFDRDLQGLVLKSNVFSSLESILCNPKSPKRIREEAGYAVAALIRFNKDVFVGLVLMGPTVHALIEIGSWNSIQVLCSLIKSIKSPLVDGIESNGEIPRIISFLNDQNLELRVMGMDCVLEIGYFGRKEAIEAMLNEGLVEILVELQRSELGGDLIDLGKSDRKENREVKAGESKEKFLEDHPFASCVARFAVQLEVGEGLRQRERRAFKQEILRRVREVSVSDAEAATIVAEVLWGSSP